MDSDHSIDSGSQTSTPPPIIPSSATEFEPETTELPSSSAMTYTPATVVDVAAVHAQTGREAPPPPPPPEVPFWTWCPPNLVNAGNNVPGIGGGRRPITRAKAPAVVTPDASISLLDMDLRDKQALEKLFSSTKFDAVIHFAGLKAVGESVQKPLLYYNNNLIGTIALLEVMAEYGCKMLVFSSSATVYGWPKLVPCSEDFPLSASNPYGRTKLFIEEICRDVRRADPEWKIILLRYFNPVGAHPSGHIGEDPSGIPNNLMPFVQQVAVGRRAALTVFGSDYKTTDGTGVRDYIHVVDLADGHIAALRKLFQSDIGCEVYNLGTGKGTSVLEMVKAFEKASGKKIPLVMAGRRPGDAEIVYASTEKAERELNWKAKYGIEEMCRDQWSWASKNPFGYGASSTAAAQQKANVMIKDA